jgi:hypothetical protein
LSAVTANRFLAGSGSRPKRSIISTCSSRSAASVGAGDALVGDQPGVDVGQVVVGQQGGEAQVDLGAVVQRAVELRGAAGLEGLDGALEQVHVEGEADLVDLAGLLVAEQLAGAADLQVVGGQREAGAQVLQRLDGLQALLGVRGHGLGGGVIR